MSIEVDFQSKAAAWASPAPAAEPAPSVEPAESEATEPAAEAEAEAEAPAEEASEAPEETLDYKALRRQRQRLDKREREVRDVEQRLQSRWRDGLTAIEKGDRAGVERFLSEVSKGKTTLEALSKAAEVAPVPAERPAPSADAVRIALGNHPATKIPGFAGALREILAESVDAGTGYPTLSLKEAADRLAKAATPTKAPAAKAPAKAPAKARLAPASSKPASTAEEFQARARDAMRMLTTKGVK